MTHSNIFKFIAIAITSIILSACSSDNFKVTGELSDFGTQNVRFIYYTNNAIQSFWIPTVDGKIEFTGVSPENTVIEIYTRQNKLLTRFAIKNGDEVEFKGSAKKPFDITASGNDITDEWCNFLNKNAETFEKGDRESIEKLIEDYVKVNPTEPVSMYLIAFNYANPSNFDKVQELLELIPDEQKTDFLISRIDSYYDNPGTKINENAVVSSFIMYSDNDSIESFTPSDSKTSLLYFWSHENKGRKDIINELKKLNKKTNKKRLQIAEIGLENDSVKWHRTFAKDSVKWKHFWALGGIMNGEVMKMGVTATPYFLVLDSVGKPIYRGESVSTACDSVNNKIKK